MTLSDDEDESLALFLESEVFEGSSDSDRNKFEEEEEGNDEKLEPPKPKRSRLTEDDGDRALARASSPPSSTVFSCGSVQIESGFFSRLPTELFRHILKFLSSEDLISCSLACRFLNYVASDESLWRRLYCMRWGLLPPTNKVREVAWKKLYIQRDEQDMVEFVRNCPVEFKEYYIQMQAAKRSQAPLPSQVDDDQTTVDKTVADQVFTWKSNRGLTDKVVMDHVCSGETCSYYQIGDVFVCEETGNVHACDDACREAVLDSSNELLVCKISGHCFDRLLSPAEIEPDPELQQGGMVDEAEPFMGSGRFARAYSLGYNCADEKELEAALRFC